MADFDYLYYELSRSIIAEVDSVLLKARRTDIRLVQGGSKFQPLSVKSYARKPSTAGFLLTVDEKSKLDKNSKLKDTVGEDRVHIITTSEELITLLEKELGSPLQPVAKGSIEETKVVAPKLSTSDVITPRPSFSESSELISEVEVTSFDNDTSLPVDDGFGLTLEDELKILRAENSELHKKLAQFNDAGVSFSELDSLKSQLELKGSELKTEKESHTKTKQTLDSVDRDFERKKLDYARLEVELDDLKGQLKESAVAPTTPLSVPHNVEIYVTASSLDLVQSYQYLLVNLKDTLVIDLSPESIMDTLVHITKRNRVGKWLLGEQNIRALYSPYDEIKTKVAEGLELLTSPNALLPVNFLSEVDWERKLAEL